MFKTTFSKYLCTLVAVLDRLKARRAQASYTLPLLQVLLTSCAGLLKTPGTLRTLGAAAMLIGLTSCLQSNPITSSTASSANQTSTVSSSTEGSYVTSLGVSLNPHFSQGSYSFALNQYVGLFPSFGITIGPDLSFSVSPSLPQGLTLSSTTGDVVGTATAITASRNYTFTAKNGANQTAYYQLTIGIFDSVGAIAYPTAALQLTGLASVSGIVPTVTGNSAGTVSVTSYYIVPAESSPSLASLGLVFDPSTGKIYGTPVNTTSSNSYTVTALDAGGNSATCTIILNITAVATSSSSSTPSSGSSGSNPSTSTGTSAPIVTYPNGNALIATNGQSTSFALTNLGSSNSAGTSFSLTPLATLTAAGLSFNTSSGAITGTPSTLLGSTTFTLSATNSVATSQTAFTLTVVDVAPASISYPNAGISTFTVGTALSGITPSGNTGGAVTSYAIGSTVSSALSAKGITFNTTTGSFSGTPTAALALQSFTVTASNTGGSFSIPVAFTILPLAPAGITFTGGNALSFQKSTAVTTSLTASTGGTPTSFSLPASTITSLSSVGLSFNSSTGVISGTPTSSLSLIPIPLTASNTGGSFLVNGTLVVNDIAPAGISYPNSNTLVGAQNSSVTWVPSGNTGGVVTSYTMSPSDQSKINAVGLYFNSGNGAIYGAPTSALSATSVGVTIGNGSGSVNLTVSVQVTASSGGSSTGVTYASNSDTLVWTKNSAGSFAPSTASYSGPAITGYSITAGNSSALTAVGISFNTTTGTFSGTPTGILSLTSITLTVTNGTTNPTVNLTAQVNDLLPAGIAYPNTNVLTYTKGASNITATPSSSTGGAVTTMSIPSSSSTALSAVGISFNTSTGVFSASSLSGILPLTTVPVTFSNATGAQIVPVAITVNDIAPAGISYPSSNVLSLAKNTAISSFSPSGNTGGTVVSYSLDSTSASIFSTLGLSFNTSTGAITGTPNAVHAATAMSITATNSGGSFLVGVNLIVTDLVPSGIAYPNSNVLSSTKGTAISLTPGAGSGGIATTFTVSGASATNLANIGLALNTTTGVISGTLTNILASTTITVNAANATGSQNIALTVVVADSIPAGITYPTSNTLVAVKNTLASFAPTSSTAGTPTSYSISPALSTAGLSFSLTTGVISGTPTSLLASTSYTVLATNSSGSQTINIYLSVNDSAINGLTYNTNNVISGNVGSALSVTPSSGSGGSVTGFSISSGQNTTLTTAGLSFNTTSGLLSGTPTSALNNLVLSITASNGGSSYTIPVTVNILSAAPGSITYPSSNAMTSTQGAAFSFSPTIATGGTPTSYSIPTSISTILTATNVSFNTSTGVLSALASPATTALTNTGFSILASNGGGFLLVNVSLTITATAPASISYATGSNAISLVAGNGGTYSPSSGSGGTPTSFALNTAGAVLGINYGLTLNTSTGVLTVPSTATTAISNASFSVTASNSGGSQTIPLTLSITATSVSIGLTVITPSTTTVAANGTATVTMTVNLKDGFSNPLSGKLVTLSSSRGASDTISVLSNTTNTSGQATFSVLSSTTGSATYTAVDSTDNTGSSPTSTTVTWTSGTASKIVVSGGNNQTITAGGTLSSISALITDAANNPVSSQVVGWAITSGSGQLPVVTSSTNASGIATLSGTPFTLTTASSNGSGSVITASIGGTSTTVNFTTTVNVGVPSLTYSTLSSSSSGLPPDNATTGTLTATIKDAYGNPISGNTVTFSAPSTIGALTPTFVGGATATTGAAGTASVLVKAATAGFALLSAATSGTVITLPSITIVWNSVPNISTTQGTYIFPSSNSPAIAVTNTGGTITSCSISPSIPTGLTFNTTTCQIAPTAGAIGTPIRGSYTISATNTLGTGTKTIEIGAYFGTGGTMGQSVCWWDANGYFKCWGYNGAGGLGDGTNTSRTTAQLTTPSVTSAANAVVAYATSSYGSTCLVTSGGAVYCSGFNTAYELGIGTTGNSTSFSVATGLTSGFASITSVPQGYCAVNTSGSLYCWGSTGGFNLFSNAATSSVTTPTLSNITTNVTRIIGGNNSICSLNTTNTVACWGETRYSNGNAIVIWGGSAGSVTGASSPIYLAGTGDTYCVINLAGTVSCFGEYEWGAFGNGGASWTGSFTSAFPAVTTASQVACAGGSGFNQQVGTQTTGSCCVLLGNGTVQCAGYNIYGALGQGNTTTTAAYEQAANTITGLSNVVALQSFGSPLAAGSTTNSGGFCAITQSGGVTCWGAMYTGFNTPSLTSVANLP